MARNENKNQQFGDNLAIFIESIEFLALLGQLHLTTTHKRPHCDRWTFSRTVQMSCHQPQTSSRYRCPQILPFLHANRRSGKCSKCPFRGPHGRFSR